MKGSWFAFEVTPRCNLSCGFCYNYWRRPGSAVPKELPLSGIDMLFGSLGAHASGSGITLTGGEPLLREDLPDIAALARSRGFTVAVATNGVLLNDVLARRLFDSGVRHFDVGVETPFREVSAGIAAASSTGATVTVSFCVTFDSFHRTGNAAGLAAALGASALCLNRFVPRGLADDQAYLPSRTELEQAFRSAGEVCSSTGLPVFAGVPLEPCVFPGLEDWGVTPTACHCGESKWAVGPDGTLRVCEQSPDVLGSVVEEGFSALSALDAVKAFRGSSGGGCSEGCAHAEGCGGGCRFLTGQGY